MNDKKEQVFENNPYWEEQDKNARQVNEKTTDADIKQTDSTDKSPKVAVLVEEDDLDSNPSLDEPLPQVEVRKEDNAITFIVNGEAFKMIKVEGGTFTMGQQDEDKKTLSFTDEKPAHQVTLDTFYIADVTVTQELWKAVYPTADISQKKGREHLPKVKISWYDCRRFAQRLSKATGYNFRMPTEAEWEFAAKGGVKSKNYKFAGTNSLSFVAWYNTGNKPIQPVKKLKTNELGLYDMSGNIYEWCADWYDKDYYASSPQHNPQGPEEGQYKVIRGGSVFSTADSCRISMRMRHDPKLREAGVGLRLVLDC